MRKKRTKQLHLRISEEEYNEIKKRASKFQSISQFVYCAIDDFNDSTVKERLDTRKRVAEYYSKIEMHLAHIGGNLNQAMRQVNEAAIVGHPTQALIINKLMPEIRQCLTACTDFRKELLTVTNRTAK